MLPVRLRRVSGFDGRLNDTVFQPAVHPPTPPAPTHQTVIFFGGDVQDYPEVMQTHRDNRNYLKWNLENTARLIGQTFPGCHVLIVRPSRTEYKSFSCFDNFVPSNNAGIPDHTPTHDALRHLEMLLQNVTIRLKAMARSELLEASSTSLPEHIDIEDLQNAVSNHSGGQHSNGSTQNDAMDTSTSSDTKPSSDSLWWRDNLALDESVLTLVGFSKGCVVLNQIIYEFHYAKTLTPGDAHMMRFMERVRAMYWLDGGHAGGKNTWITSRSLLETLTRLNIEIFVHVSPYQVKDEGRPWIGREEKTFTTLLTKLGANVKRYLHEEPGAAHTLQMHFDVLSNFRRTQETTEPTVPDSNDEDSI